jgi:short-subunit dehydrogenase
VTGGSDGIGLQYCKDLAKQGFNICIIARNEQKMKEKLEEIKRECGK